ncbi:helix-turn-helix domain-containing protein [Paenarthrobacter aurescens]|uniref:AraC family transcriptional regulator n=2 Tax=Paenarthrobacter aurescens TaxID=43663 RepID=A0A4Y3NK90_PAEAU|nr:helix-turn-helix domain-containing protein [Paenarthrobacter aurescens]MDO6145386.1 helix-turn-helix domain-containing protein [Paenarthrobacter aurescens]MDO6149191.1 helix-turn-helix domain-containing protein [Paenarthrobacter aurescens]MDO6160435.1 helix-turn-helix domain-containing protein [Paenarthrobacter aurescens]MDO6164294.1 helix-turn-helix domain-containing protein [Paenarthrobacter aurescens]GEB19586.1 AraC family transcriptional regulator [Paenarthrobacter aurescens]
MQKADGAQAGDMMQGWNRAIELIERDLTTEVEVRALATAALTSEYHFRRMFSSLAGIPISEYIRRRRLTAATAEVLEGLTVLDVAVRYGYGSAEAFNRAFKAMHGLSPSEARLPGAVLHSQPQLRFHLRVEGNTDMKHRIEDRPAFRLIGLKARVPLVHQGPNNAIIEFQRGLDPSVTKRLLELADMEPAGPLSVTDNIEEERTEGSELDYWHAVASTKPAPEGFESLEVPAGLWVVFEAEGKFPGVLQSMWADAATEWFPANPYRWAPGPEMLSVQVEPGGTHGRGQLWIPVEREDLR